MNNRIRVLYIVPSLRLCNGVASYAMNYFRNIDKSKIQIDFITGVNEESIYYDEIKKAGSKIYYIPKIGIKNILKVNKQIKLFFKENANKYDIIHCHVLNMGAFYLHYAKKYGIKVRILHSHVTKTADSTIHEIRNKILLPVAIKNANYLYSCSVDAGNKIFKNRKFRVINNAIDGERFEFNESARQKMRRRYNISDETFVIGNIGRLCNQKNQKFLINVYEKINIKKQNTKLIIVGNGPLEKELKDYVDKVQLKDKVMFINATDEIEKIYQMFDVFVLPSIYEGLGIVLLEAQVSGLPCVASDVIPKEAQISNKYEKVSLKSTYEEWAEIILNSRHKDRISNIEELKAHNFDICIEANKLKKYYTEHYNEEYKNR